MHIVINLGKSKGFSTELFKRLKERANNGKLHVEHGNPSKIPDEDYVCAIIADIEYSPDGKTLVGLVKDHGALGHVFKSLSESIPVTPYSVTPRATIDSNGNYVTIITYDLFKETRHGN